MDVLSGLLALAQQGSSPIRALAKIAADSSVAEVVRRPFGNCAPSDRCDPRPIGRLYGDCRRDRGGGSILDATDHAQEARKVLGCRRFAPRPRIPPPGRAYSAASAGHTERPCPEHG